MYQFDLFLFMKKSTVMLWAIFGALLMGCSDEEIANVETSSRNAIGFNVLSNAAETRATPTTPSNLTSTDFDVFAFTADGTAFMGKVDTDFEHDGVKIVYKDGKWDYDDANVSIRPRACFFPLFSFLPLWLHYNLNPLCAQY